MNAERFNEIVNKQIEDIKDILLTKSIEYATDDRLYNFKKGNELFGSKDLPSSVCWGYMLKHLVSVHDIANGIRAASLEQINEKIGDSINYLILLKGLLIEQLEQKNG